MNYMAGAAPVTLDAGLSVSDAEAASLASATVSISAGFLPGDVLSVGSSQTDIASSYNSATGVLTLSGAASLAAYQTELNSVAFASPGATNPSRTIAWSANDGVAASAPASSTVSVSSVDPPATPAITPPNFFNGVDKAGILWQNTNGDVELWSPNSGAGGFAYENLGDVNTTWQIVGTGDFNGIGESGILWRNADGDTELWNANGLGGFSYDNLGSVSTSWQIAGTGDFNGSGETGILWRNANGGTELWNPNGSGGFSYDNLGSVNGAWQVAGTGDFTGTGADGILWRNAANGDVELWNPNGSGGFAYDNLGAVNSSWQIAGTGDFTGTGEDSILWRNTSGATELWNPNGSGGFTYQKILGPSTQAGRSPRLATLPAAANPGSCGAIRAAPLSSGTPMGPAASPMTIWASSPRIGRCRKSSPEASATITGDEATPPGNLPSRYTAPKPWSFLQPTLSALPFCHPGAILTYPNWTLELQGQLIFQYAQMGSRE